MFAASVVSGQHREATVIYGSRSKAPAAKCFFLSSITDGGHVMLTSLLTCRSALRGGVMGLTAQYTIAHC